VIALARLPFARLSRTPRAWLGAAVWFLLASWLALAARRSGATHGADRVLLDGYAGYALPLLAYAIVGAALGGGSLAAAIAPVVTFGASKHRAAIATLGAAAERHRLLVLRRQRRDGVLFVRRIDVGEWLHELRLLLLE